MSRMASSGCIFLAIIGCLAGTAPDTLREASGSLASPSESAASLIADLRSDGTHGNMDRAMFDLAQDKSAETRALLLSAQETSDDAQQKDAIVAALWYCTPNEWVAPVSIVARTLELVAASSSEHLLQGTMYAYDCVAARFLAQQVALERETPTRPRTEQVRAMANEGRGRGRLISMGVLAHAHDARDTSLILAYLAPHMEDNSIARDAAWAERALVEIAAHQPHEVRALVESPCSQTRSIAARALRTRVEIDALGDRFATCTDPWERTPGATGTEIDALHPAPHPAPHPALHAPKSACKAPSPQAAAPSR